MSRAVVRWRSGPGRTGRPFGLTKFDERMPMSCAVRFISTTKFSTEPETPSASRNAMSFADCTISIFSASSTVTVWPT